MLWTLEGRTDSLRRLLALHIMADSFAQDIEIVTNIMDEESMPLPDLARRWLTGSIPERVVMQGIELPVKRSLTWGRQPRTTPEGTLAQLMSDLGANVYIVVEDWERLPQITRQALDYRMIAQPAPEAEEILVTQWPCAEERPAITFKFRTDTTQMSNLRILAGIK